jgi:hypothetical protein
MASAANRLMYVFLSQRFQSSSVKADGAGDLQEEIKIALTNKQLITVLNLFFFITKRL